MKCWGSFGIFRKHGLRNSQIVNPRIIDDHPQHWLTSSQYHPMRITMPSADYSDNDRQMMERFFRELASKGRISDALCEAARWGYVDLLKELLMTHILDNEQTEQLSKALSFAASGGQIEVVKYLIECGADVNAVTGKNCMTPLISCLAAFHSKKVYLTICKALLNFGAANSLHIRDINGRNAMDWAKDGRPAEVAALIEERILEYQNETEDNAASTFCNVPDNSFQVPKLEIRDVDGCFVATYGSHEITLPSPKQLKTDAIEAALDSNDGIDNAAIAVLRDSDLDYEVVPGKDAMEMLIGVIVTVSKDNVAILEEVENHVLSDVMGAILEACPELGAERIVSRQENT